MSDIHELLDYGLVSAMTHLNRMGVDAEAMVEENIKDECPVDTGALRDSIAVTGDSVNVDEDYASFVNEGHTCVNGTVVPANPFVERGLDISRNQIDKIV